MGTLGSYTPRRRVLDAALIVCAAIASLYATASAALAPRDAEAGLAVVFAPWTGEREAFVRSAGAGARFVRFGGYGFIAVEMPEVPDYAARVREAGAWMLADPRALAACLSFAGGGGR